MSEDWQAGDIAECIDNSPPEGIGWLNDEPALHGLYTVERVAGGAVAYSDPNDVGTALFFIDLKRSAEAILQISREVGEVCAVGYGAERFRKVLRPDPEFLTRLMENQIDLPPDPMDYPRPARRVKEDA